MTDIINILCIGEAMAELAGLKATLAALANYTHVSDLASAVALLDNPSPTTHHRLPTTDIIVLLQSYPSQFAAIEVEQIRRLVPLARWIAVLGTWCEGEARSGQPLPGVMRVYWHQAESHFRSELAKLQAGRHSIWSLPVTATDEERLLAVIDEPLEQRSGLVAIHATNRNAAYYLSDICRLGGYETVLIDPARPAKVQGALAAIYNSPAINGSHADATELAMIQRFIKAMALAPVYVLASFPRLETIEQLTAIGVRRVLSTPIIITELLWHLQNNDAHTLECKK